MASEHGSDHDGIIGQREQVRAFIRHTDTPLFREQSIPRVHGALERVVSELTPALRERQPKRIQEVLISSSDTLARAVLNAEDNQGILALPNSGIIHESGRIQWVAPEDPLHLEDELTYELATRYCRDEIG